MGLVEIAAGKVLSSFSVFLFLTVLLLVVARRISTSVLLFSLQSAIIAAEVFAVGFRERLAEAYVVGALVLVIKVVVIPLAFFRLVSRLKTPRDVKASTTPAQSVFVAAVMIYLSYAAVHSYGQSVHVPEDALAASVALILTGAFLMVSRNKALMADARIACSGERHFLGSTDDDIWDALGYRNRDLLRHSHWASADGNLHLPHSRHL